MRLGRHAVGCLCAGLGLAAMPARAQLYTRPELRWETIHTVHFDVHFPRTMRPWAVDAAGRLEGVHDAVVALVGSGPTRKVTVVIDDPYNVSNGASLPILDAPTIVLWPTPPEPSEDIGHASDWVELLTVHEFAHIAHLTRPSRNTLQRVLWRLLPVDISPIVRNSPRWVIEGYATYIEGRLTGSGRPNSVARAGVLRQFALEGRLPAYSELNGSSQYLGGSMAYLAGSAFLEWLVARSGEESLPHLWRRMTARQDRTFTAAFAGVFGDTPQALYGRFTTELTGKALRAADDIAAAGLDSGETFQHLTWYTGDPALSRDGASIAVPVRVPGHPSRIVVWATAPAPPDTATAAAIARMLARDPEDVAAVQPYPAPRRPVAVLDAARGIGYDLPRFFSDGDRLLVSHDEPLRDGALRPDLYEWNLRTKQIRRITRGAAVRGADPAPDGRTAIGVRCLGGICDVVSVGLQHGTVSVLLAGSPTREYYRPRFAPDGRTAIVTVHDSARQWHLETFALGDSGATDVHAVGPQDGASRYAASYMAGGGSVVTVSELGGVQHLEIIELASGAMHPLAATTGGAVAPEASLADSHVFFLSLSARGRDLHRIDAADARPAATPMLSSSLAPAAVPPAPPADSLPPATVGPASAYGFGPHGYRYLPGGSISPDGRYFTLWFGSSDPVGRLAWSIQGSIGDPGTWRGGAAAATWRGLPVAIDLSAFAVSQFPSRQTAGRFASDSLDATYRGGLLAASYVAEGTPLTSEARLGVSAARMTLDGGPGHARSVAFAAYTGSADLSRGDVVLFGSAGGTGAIGTTDATSWQRLLVHGALAAGIGGWLLRYRVLYGLVNHDAPLFEHMVAGGTPSPLTDSVLLTQRVAVPALPLGVAGGNQLLDQRVEGAVGPVALYYERLSALTAGDANHDVYGAEIQDTFRRVPFVGLPSVWLMAGAGYSISAPFKYKLRGYAGIRYTP
jgi:hypothetical protein